MIVTKDSTNVSVELYIIDSTDGTPEVGVVFNTAGIDLNYRRDSAAVVSITEIDLTTPALTDAHEDGGFLEVGNGRYRLDVPDAAFATGVDKVTIGGTITGMVVLPYVVMLQDAPALASVATEARLAELDAGNLPTDIAAIPTTAMRGTDSAATAASLATAQLDLDTITGTDGVNLLSATQATLDDVPTTAEFEARTLVAASYFDPAADTVANVTTVATTTTNTDMLTAAAILTTQMTEAYAADGVAPTLAQSLFLIQQALTEVAIVSTTETIKKLDGSTAAATLTLDSASAPTSKTRAT